MGNSLPCRISRQRSDQATLLPDTAATPTANPAAAPAADQTQNDHPELSVAELSIRTTLYGILLLTVGLVLVTDWLVKGTNMEFKYGEGYTVTLMIISLTWMAYIAITNCKVIRERKQNNAEASEGELGTAHKHREPGTKMLIYSLTLFAGVSVLLSVFQLVENIEDKCVTALAVLFSVFKLLYIPSQLYIIYRARQKVTFKKCTLTGIMLIHIIITNIVLYTWTFIKSKEGILAERHENKAQKDGNDNQVELSSLSSTTIIPFHNLSTSVSCNSDAYASTFPWLYPFFLEFSLTASAMVAEIWVQCANGHNEKRPLLLKKNDVAQNRSTILAKKVSIFIFIAHIGIILTMVQDVKTETSVALWYWIHITDYIFIIMLSAAGLWMLKDSTRTGHEATELDEVLLFIATFGAFVLATFRAFPSTIQLFKHEDPGYASVAVIAELLAIVGAIVQPMFISKSLHYTSSTENYIHNTLHEASIGLLLAACNMGMWLMHTVDVEGLDHSIYSNNTYSKINHFQLERYHSSWTLMLLFAFPIVLFYRLHSALMLYRVSRIHSKTNRSQPQKELEDQLSAFQYHMQKLEKKRENLQQAKRRFFAEHREEQRKYEDNNARVQQRWQDFANEFV